MEIHQLEYVLALAKHKKFYLAADEIHVSQSTLSDQIKKLEKELGVELFIRTTRKVQITPAGEKFVVYAKRILADIQKAYYDMSDHSNLLKGRINIGAVPHITYLGITKIIAAFQKTYPGLDIVIHEENSDSLLHKLHAAMIDVAFITSPYVANFELEFYPLVHHELVLLLSKDHPLASRKVVSLQELSKEKFLMVKTGSGLQQTVIQGCRNAGFEPNIILKSNHIETIKSLIEEGIGVTLITRPTAEYISSSKTVVVNLKDPARSTTGLAVIKKNRTLFTNAFCDFILNATAPNPELINP